jgi:trehalose-phosphatase
MTTRNLLEWLPSIARRVNQARSIFLGLDFDGTLVPICPRPDDVVLSDRVRETLRVLSGLAGVTVMIVSGRSLADVTERVGLPELTYAGNHGLEIRGPGLDFVEPTAAALTAPLREHSARLEELLRDVPGVLVEPKGLTTSVHDRNVPSEFRARVEQTVRDVVARDSDRFVITPGNRVWEIRPRVSWHKGRAILWVLDQPTRQAPPLTFYVGDDRTDEDAFTSLTGGVTVNVGDATTTRASYTLASPAEVEQFLDWLLETLNMAVRRFPW